MWLRLKRVLSNRTVMLRIAFTFFVLMMFRIASHIPVPLYDTNAIKALIESSGSFFAILNNFSGQAMERFSILALGISPYITASIVVQLLQTVLPTFKEWSEEGESGRAKLNRITRAVAVFIAVVQSLALILGATTGIGNNFVVNFRGNNYVLASVYLSLVITAGTCVSIFVADLITARGIGNGSSILIAAGIVTSIPVMFSTMWRKYIINNTSAWQYVWFITITILYFLILLGIVFVEAANRKIPVQYANRQQGGNANIPIKVNSASVMPVIFASTILSIPLTIAGFVTKDTSKGAGYWLNQVFSFQKPIGFVIYLVLIVIFSFFYSFMTINPSKISENLSKQNGYIKGIRPGEDTKNFIAKTLFKTTVVGTIYIATLAAIPVLTGVIFGLEGQDAQAITLGGTSLLIVVGVAVETMSQIETSAEKDTYEGIF